MSHTPGPWRVANGVQIMSSNAPIAKVWMMRKGEGKRNAALIAEAPNLLDLVEEMLDNVPPLREWSERAREVVARIKGEET